MTETLTYDGSTLISLALVLVCRHKWCNAPSGSSLVVLEEHLGPVGDSLV